MDSSETENTTQDDGSGISSEEFRDLGYRFVDLMCDALECESLDPVLKPVSGQRIREIVQEPLPRAGSRPESLLEECRSKLLPYCRRNGHPRFFGYVCASADPLGALADGLASILNQNLTAWRSAPAAVEMERLVIAWMDELSGFRGGGHGVLTSGGSAANFNGICCALEQARKAAGIGTGDLSGLCLYVSEEGHLSLVKAARLLGMSPDNVRVLGVDEDRRLTARELESALRRDRSQGRIPACVCASSGTASTGAIDHLDEIAQVCRRWETWLHIDGSYGAPAVLVEDYAWMTRAFARADSLSLDAHKWLFAPMDVGCALVRHPEVSASVFAESAEYVKVSQSDPIEKHAFFDHGSELSRRFRALKVWMIIKAQGVEGLASRIKRNIGLRRRLDQRIESEPRLERLGSELSISCFRFVPDGWRDRSRLNALNSRILESLLQGQSFYLSPTTLEDRFALRICIVNFRTRSQDIDFLIDEVLRLGEDLEASI